MTSYRATLAVAFVFAFCAVPMAQAASITPLVQKACRNDYRKFCNEYGLETKALRLCMDRVSQRLSHGCVHALIEAYEVSMEEVKRRKKSGR